VVAGEVTGVVVEVAVEVFDEVTAMMVTLINLQV
jgi:hypothetical protein